MKSRLPIDADHDPKTANFWAKFQSELGQEQHSSCPALYSSHDGEFFIVMMPGPGPARRDGTIQAQAPATYDLIGSKDELIPSWAAGDSF